MSFYSPQRLMEGSSALHPEMVEELRKLKEEKRSSRKIIKASELKWTGSRQVSRTARLIDPRLGFKNSFCNLGISEIAPQGHTGKHKHSEAYIYILKGKGHSMIGDERHDWSEGDALFVPPDTFHQHFNDGDEPARYLRILPGPLALNLLAVLASLNASFDGSFVAAEASPDYKGALKSYFG